MRILVRMPNHLGDAVMATPALGNLVRHFQGAEIILVGSAPVADLFRPNPAFRAVQADTSKSRANRLAGIWAMGRQIRTEHGPLDLGVAMTNSFSSALLLFACRATRRAAARRLSTALLLSHPVRVDRTAHQAEIYNQIVNGLLGTDYETEPTHLYVPHRHHYPKRTLGINPGAAYGSAKRWLPERFAEVAAQFSHNCDIVIFGAANDRDVAFQVEKVLQSKGVRNCQNLAGQTDVQTLLSMIAGLDLMITNDSGPMHMAGALGVPCVAVFGPTDHVQTAPWRHVSGRIVRHDLPCAPCLRRTCPLKHHACMTGIEAKEVANAALEVLNGQAQ